MFLWTMILSAAAAPVDEARLAALRDQVAPLVERVVGRRLVERPPVTIERERSLTQRLSSSYTLRFERAGLSHERAVTESTALIHAVVDHALALYDEDTRSIVVINDNMEKWIISLNSPQFSESDACSCVMVHELTHALQHQYAPEPPELDLDTALRRRAVQEGQAMVAQELACTGKLALAGALVAESRPKVELTQPLDLRTNAFLYGAGTAWVRDLWAREGSEAVWAALGAPPPAGTVVAHVQASRRGSWWDEAWLSRVADAWAGEAVTETSRSDVSLGGMLRTLGHVLMEEIPSSDSGFFWAGQGKEASVMLGVWSVRDTTRAERWIWNRKEALHGLQMGRQVALLTRSDVWFEKPLVFRTIEEGGRGFLFQLGRGNYTEAWMRVGEALMVLTSSGSRGGTGARLARIQDAVAFVPAPPAPAPTPAPAPLVLDQPLAESWCAGSEERCPRGGGR